MSIRTGLSLSSLSGFPFISTFKFLLEVASTVYQIPFSIYRLNHAAFFANVINYVDEFLTMNHFGILGINPICSWCFYPYDVGLNSI